MKDFVKKNINLIRLNSFHPLCSTEIGLSAIQHSGFPPFIDGSCRREPDLESPFPSITALCRKGKFAPILKENDVIVYITVQGNWQTNYIHHRLVAILEVVKLAENHEDAALWYKSHNIAIPSNCMIENNLPKLFHETAGNIKSKKEIRKFLGRPLEKQLVIGKRFIELWDGEYKQRAENWKKFIITKPLYAELNNPPILATSDLYDIFGKKPNTQTPKKITIEQLKLLAKLANINLITE